LFARVVEQTAGWVMHEMQSAEGGYYSSLDADSEHEEGKFYVWTLEEVRSLLSADEYAVAEPHFGLDGSPNFEDKYWHLRVAKPLRFVAARIGATEDACRAILEAARIKLFAARAQRVRPGRDEKILTSWNALMIRGMARAARQFERGDWLASAERAATFLRSTMHRDGRLYATHKDGTTHLNAYLDDYAFLLDAVLELLHARFDAEDLSFAQSLAEALLGRFEDSESGGFFFTSHDHERLIHRGKPGQDNATPSGNGIAAFALQRLGHLLGEARYLASTERTLQLYWPQIGRYPSGHASLLKALEEHLHPIVSVVLRGPRESLSPWQDALRERYRPATMVLAIPNGVEHLPQTLAHPDSGAVNAWVCQGVKCLAPIVELEKLEQALASESQAQDRPQ
jgi:uncharacterized protein YyaL (SSP411 family)